MTKEQQEILEQDRKDTQEYIDSLSQEELDNIPVEEDLLSDEELQELEDNFHILLEQYTSNLEEIEKYMNKLKVTMNITKLEFKVIKFIIKQINKENKILLEEIKSSQFNNKYCVNN